MSSALSWARIVRGDLAWCGVAAALALGIGIVGDQVFRRSPLGLRYQSAAQRVLSAGSTGETAPVPINLVMLEEMDALLADPQVAVLDARPRIFFEFGHLPGARCLSREQFDADFAVLEAELRTPGKTLLIYCADAGCEDSALVGRALQARGFEKVLIFPGGFAEWEAAGRPVEEGA